MQVCDIYLRGININNNQNSDDPSDQQPGWLSIKSRDHLVFFRHFGARQHNENFVLLQIFQPMTAQFGNIDCHTLFLLVEILQLV